MAIKIQPNLLGEIEEYGAVNASACFNCGNCTAICGLVEEGGAQFPRKIIRYLQLGLKEKVLESTEPWMCYYCGECSATCPRDANPGEIMMGVRRYATAQYDVTGLSKHYYKSHKASLIGILTWFVLPIIFLIGLNLFGSAEIVTERVELNSFAPVETINTTAHIYALLIGASMIGGMYKMWRMIMNKESAPGVKISDYVSEFKTIFTKGATVKRWLDCGEEHKFRWLKHYILVLSYGTMFLLVVGFLKWFQTDEIYSITHPQRWIGYLATIGLIITTLDIIRGRMKKEAEIHKHSHHTDWVFPISILLVAITGILINIFRYSGLPWPTYIIYAIHLGVTAVMLSTEVGVGKWAHVFYRPMALYFDAVKRKAANRIAADE